MQIIRFLNQRRRDSGIDLRGEEAFMAYLLLDHAYRNAGSPNVHTHKKAKYKLHVPYYRIVLI
jgi:hypothetical protein